MCYVYVFCISMCIIMFVYVSVSVYTLTLIMCLSVRGLNIHLLTCMYSTCLNLLYAAMAMPLVTCLC